MKFLNYILILFSISLCPLFAAPLTIAEKRLALSMQSNLFAINNYLARTKKGSPEKAIKPASPAMIKSAASMIKVLDKLGQKDGDSGLADTARVWEVKLTESLGKELPELSDLSQERHQKEGQAKESAEDSAAKAIETEFNNFVNAELSRVHKITKSDTDVPDDYREEFDKRAKNLIDRLLKEYPREDFAPFVGHVKKSITKIIKAQTNEETWMSYWASFAMTTDYQKALKARNDAYEKFFREIVAKKQALIREEQEKAREEQQKNQEEQQGQQQQQQEDDEREEEDEQAPKEEEKKDQGASQPQQQQPTKAPQAPAGPPSQQKKPAEAGKNDKGKEEDKKEISFEVDELFTKITGQIKKFSVQDDQRGEYKQLNNNALAAARSWLSKIDKNQKAEIGIYIKKEYKNALDVEAKEHIGYFVGNERDINEELVLFNNAVDAIVQGTEQAPQRIEGVRSKNELQALPFQEFIKGFSGHVSALNQEISWDVAAKAATERWQQQFVEFYKTNQKYRFPGLSDNQSLFVDIDERFKKEYAFYLEKIVRVRSEDDRTDMTDKMWEKLMKMAKE